MKRRLPLYKKGNTPSFIFWNTTAEPLPQNSGAAAVSEKSSICEPLALSSARRISITTLDPSSRLARDETICSSILCNFGVGHQPSTTFTLTYESSPTHQLPDPSHFPPRFLMLGRVAAGDGTAVCKIAAVCKKHSVKIPQLDANPAERENLLAGR